MKAKLLIVPLLLVFTSLPALADLSLNDLAKYKYPSRIVEFFDARTNERLQDRKITVNYYYEYMCVTDLIRVTACVDGKDFSMELQNGVLRLAEQEIEKSFLTSHGAYIEFVFQGTCQGQEWSPARCTVEIPLKLFKKSPNPLQIRVPFISR